MSCPPLWQEAVETHVGAAGKRQQRFVNVRNLERDSFRLYTSDRHDFASPLAEVRDGRPVGHRILSAIARELILNDVNDRLSPPTQSTRRDVA